MEKAVLVIDMPTKCDECRFHYETYDENDYYVDKCELLDDMTIDGYSEKYDGCPIKSLPEKLNEEDIRKQAISEDCYDGTELEDWYISGKVRGWNSLLEELLNQTDI